MSDQQRALAFRRNRREVDSSKVVEKVDTELLRSLEAHYPDLANARSYRWFSEENFQNAENYFRALSVAHRHSRRDQVKFFAEAIVDVYNKDRAERASDSMGLATMPKRLQELPRRIKRKGDDYTLRLKQVEGFPSVPHAVMNRVSDVYLETQDAPDMLLMGKYTRSYGGALRDPIIYARYGNWFVKLGEWT